MQEEACEVNINLLPQESQQNISGVQNENFEFITEKLKQVENELFIKTKQNENLLSEVSDRNEKLTLKENELRVSKDQSEQCKAGASDTEVKLKQTETELEMSRNQNEQLNNDVSHSKAKLKETEDELKTLSQGLKNIQFEKENLDCQLLISENENEKLRIDCYNVSQAGKDPIKAMVVLAGPGEDKSGLCDLFSGTENNFPAIQEKTIGKIVKWRGDGDQFLLIDTPVFEPEEDVAEATKIMMKELKKYKNMYVFVIALNGTNPRIDQNRKKMIRELKNMFGHTFIDKNTVFAITNWHYDQGSIEKREKSGQKEIKVNGNLQKELNLTNVNIAFLDASYGKETIEKAKIEEQLHKMKHWLFNLPSYSCTNLKQM